MGGGVDGKSIYRLLKGTAGSVVDRGWARMHPGFLAGINRPLFATSNQSSGKQPKSHEIMRLRSQSDDGY